MSLRHIHLRKRSSAGLAPYPARGFWLRLLDTAVLAAGIVGPVVTIPQILIIYGSHSASGVSAFSWGMYALLNIPWILYGVAHKERPIVVTYCLWIVVNSIVAIGALLYGA